MSRTKHISTFLLGGLLAACLARPAAAQGIALPAAGAINQSMAGAGVAAPLDAMGSLFWNPAGIGVLPHSEMSFGLGLLWPSTRVDSAIGFAGMAGSDRGEPGVMPIPNAAFVYRDDNSPFTYGLGMYGIGGFATNYPGSLTNPVFSPPPPNGVAQGHISAAVEILQIAPTIAVALTQRLTLGFTPTIDLGRLSVTPMILAPPDDANGDTVPSYPSAQSTRYAWGFGGHFGALYTADNGLNFGASIKSPQWFQKFNANSSNELGQPRALATSVDFPMIISLGVGYTGFERWTLASDLRYLDYPNTDGFRTTGYNADGSVAGLGWHGVYAWANGVQYQATERLSLRAGYAFNTNPIRNADTFFNIASPLITQNLFSCGGSYEFAPGCLASLSYTHALQNSVTGPIILPPSFAVPTSSVTSFVSADLLIANITVRF